MPKRLEFVDDIEVPLVNPKIDNLKNYKHKSELFATVEAEISDHYARRLFKAMGLPLNLKISGDYFRDALMKAPHFTKVAFMMVYPLLI